MQAFPFGIAGESESEPAVSIVSSMLAHTSHHHQQAEPKMHLVKADKLAHECCRHGISSKLHYLDQGLWCNCH